MSYHPITKTTTDLLTQNNCWFETFEHAPVRTSEEAATTRPGYTLHQGAKAMIVRVKKSAMDKFFAMLVLPADCRFDNEKVRRLFGAKDVRFASEMEVAEITSGVLPGGVPPFGNLFELPVIMEPTILQNEKIVFNAGDRSFSVAMKSEDYQKLATPQVAEIIVR
jgi:prolyl-tRNA editing enzyme YbaK/EbsC (Cys-tRNA(Pro) deacylase)